MAVKTYPVRWYNEKMQGVPSLPSSTYDASFIPFWKALLVNGFGSTLLSTLVWDAAAGWAKATIDAGHTFQKDQVIEIEGANEVEYLGEHRVMQVTTNDVWFELNATPSGAATGTVSMKTPGMGWSIVDEAPDGSSVIFSAAGDEGNVFLRMLQDTSYFGTAQKLACVQQVENVVSYETFDTISTRYWAAAHWYGNGAQWDLIGDSKLFYWSTSYGARYGTTSSPTRSVFVAGYIKSIRPGDRYHFIFNGMYSMDPNSATYSWSNYDDKYRTSLLAFSDSSGNTIARKASQLKGTSAFKLMGSGACMGTGLPYPNTADNGFYIDQSEVPVQEYDGTLRGYLPGLLNPLHRDQTYVGENLRDLPSFPGETLRFITGAYDHAGANAGDWWELTKQTLVAFRIGDGGWR